MANMTRGTKLTAAQIQDRLENAFSTLRSSRFRPCMHERQYVRRDVRGTFAQRDNRFRLDNDGDIFRLVKECANPACGTVLDIRRS